MLNLEYESRLKSSNDVVISDVDNIFDQFWHFGTQERQMEKVHEQ